MLLAFCSSIPACLSFRLKHVHCVRGGGLLLCVCLCRYLFLKRLSFIIIMRLKTLQSTALGGISYGNSDGAG